MLRSGLLPCILHTLLRRDCFGTDFTHVQSCDVTLVQSAIRSGLLPYILHIRTSCSTVEGYLHLQAVASREDVTCRSCRGQGASRHVTSRHVRTSQAPLWTRRPSRHVTSRHVRTSQAPPWTRRPSRHVTSRQDITGAAVDKDAVTSRHVRTSGAVVDKEAVASRHVTSRVDKEAVTSRHVTTSGAPRADHASSKRSGCSIGVSVL